jgi:hypothetical protein
VFDVLEVVVYRIRVRVNREISLLRMKLLPKILEMLMKSFRF